uniref:Uncharacterized protein n=1 Tax=Vespula pensylvanica TaxID=30213 RepID=A0A834N8K7_VESPE|nr:hypothetical protein H0235_015924 [Vespula pensylvanica]
MDAPQVLWDRPKRREEDKEEDEEVKDEEEEEDEEEEDEDEDENKENEEGRRTLGHIDVYSCSNICMYGLLYSNRVKKITRGREEGAGDAGGIGVEKEATKRILSKGGTKDASPTYLLTYVDDRDDDDDDDDDLDDVTKSTS